MISFLRKYKISYALYNFFQKDKLAHNISIYKKYGLSKKYYSPVSSKDFSSIEEKFKRKEDVSLIENTSFYKNQSSENRESLVQFYDNGYAIIQNFLSHEKVEAINNTIEKLLADKKIHFQNKNKLMFAIHQSELIKSIGEDSNLIELLSVLFDGKAKLFQSINFLSGSEQHTHSDSIHMTTFPLGGLLGVWIALEDMTIENGPLHYYPKSHKLPYFLNSDYDNEGSYFKLGEKGYHEYEVFLQKRVEELKLEKQVFTCKKGDMLIWHANILHGGEPHTNKQKTRKSMVFHYFDEDSICYHEVTQRPAIFKD